MSSSFHWALVASRLATAQISRATSPPAPIVRTRIPLPFPPRGQNATSYAPNVPHLDRRVTSLHLAHVEACSQEECGK
jgi:hypothetical protein